MKRGILMGLGAYALWGMFPLYWRWLAHVPALELVAHRIAWSLVFLIIIMTATRRWRRFRETSASVKAWGIFLLQAGLIGINWLVYVWAVNAGYVVESSLGYFINPLVNVLLGVLILKERLRTWQWVPVGIAGVGVVYLSFSYGRLPWIALTLALSFGFYGLVKKLSPVGPVQGMFSEIAILFIPAAGYLVASEVGGTGAFFHTGLTSDLLMVGAGLVTTIPLLLFASGARLVPLSLMGVLQYLAPTLQFLIGVVVFQEAVPASRWIGFAIIWGALGIFAVEGWLAGKAKAIVPTA